MAVFGFALRKLTLFAVAVSLALAPLPTAVAEGGPALAIDPYPRKPGVDFSDHIEDDGSADRRAFAFSALKDWKKD